MKRLLTIVATALVLTGCTQHELLVPRAEVTFGPSTVSTKALINPWGAENGEISFPQTESFAVSAIVDDDPENFLMNNVLIENREGEWKAASENVYLWPEKGTVDFYAYYPYSAENARLQLVNETFRWNLSNVNLGSTIGDQIDPLVATTNDQIATEMPVVKMVFKHISSQVVVMARDATTRDELKGKIRLKEVKINGVSIKGDYLDGPEPGKGGEWTNQDHSTEFVLFQGNEYLTEDDRYLNIDQLSDDKENCALFVVVPTPLNTDVQTISVVYDIDEFTLNGQIYSARPDQKASVSLYDYNKNWEFKAGVRYVYHLGFSMNGANNEIRFEPVVSGWEQEDINNIVFDCFAGKY
ncbi:MAG: fimbrillin family protein [Bacteroidaceae bacterium]|nr:fimbrillin family protein [Bacteroidaceae bacterium]